MTELRSLRRPCFAGVVLCVIGAASCDLGAPGLPTEPERFRSVGEMLLYLSNCPPDCDGALTEHDLDLLYEEILSYTADDLEHCNAGIDQFEDWYDEHKDFLNGVPGAQVRFKYIPDGYPAFTDRDQEHPGDTFLFTNFGQCVFEGSCSGYAHSESGKIVMHEFTHISQHLHNDSETDVQDMTEACWGGGGYY